MKQYRAIGLGGTFDRFHVGHRHFLQFASQLADKVVIGITTPQMTQHKTMAGIIEPLETRQAAVEAFLKEQQISGEVFVLEDIYGPTLEHAKVDAVAVTEQTVPGATAINRKRAALGLPALPVHICSLLKDIQGEFISSTRIRKGQIDRNGAVYALLIRDGLTLSPEQSAFFKPPQGPVVLTVDPSSLAAPTLVVGDIVSETFIKNGWPYSLAVFDRRSVREEYYSAELQEAVNHAEQLKIVSNPAGQLSKELVHWLEAFCNQLPEKQPPSPAYLQIDGEEDLVTVGLVLLAPLTTEIFYGQPQQGMVRLTVTEELKDRFRKVLS